MEDVNATAPEAETEAKVSKSIIGEKYRGKYKGAQDWLASTIDANVKVAVTKEKVTTAEDGTKTTEIVDTAKTEIDLNKLFALAIANHINVDKYRGDVDKKNAPGRLRMTIGNMLRAVAKKRHGMFVLTADGSDWVDAPAEFIGDSVKTHNSDGSKIVVAKPETASTETEAA